MIRAAPAVAGALALLGAAGARAQEQALPSGIGLPEIVEATLARSPEIRVAAQRAESARGAFVSAGAVFDTRVQIDGTAVRAHGEDPLDGADAIRNQITYRLEASRLLRNGVLLQPHVGLARTGFSTLPGAATNNVGTVALDMALPLLQDRGGASSGASERAAGYDHKSARLEVRHTAAQRVLEAVDAYWIYLAAHRRLDVLRGSEARAQEIADQTRVLVEADERTAADLTQTLGNLASKKVSRLGAEQAVVEARERLGLAVGLTPERIASLPPPATDFPALLPPGSPRAGAEKLVEMARVSRADLAAAEQDLLASESLVKGARDELKPRLDIVVGTGYSSTGTGLGLGGFFSPLVHRGPRLDASVQLTYKPPITNSQARGRLLQSSALSEQRRLSRDDLQRRVAVAVAVASEALARGEASVRESDEAVRLLDATVQAEQRKFGLGFSTLFDVIQAQDALTGAQLARIQSQGAYAAAVAALRFESGTLLTADREAPRVDAASLVTPP